MPHWKQFPPLLTAQRVEQGQVQKKDKREGQSCRQRLKKCLLQERAHSGAQMAPGSSYGTLRTASQMQPQLSWTSLEGLSRQLDPNPSQTGQKGAVSGTNREGTGLCCTNGQHHASRETNGNGTAHAHQHSWGKDAQQQQPSMQAGEHVRLSYQRTCLKTFTLPSMLHSYLIDICVVPSRDKHLVTCLVKQDNLF